MTGAWSEKDNHQEKRRDGSGDDRSEKGYSHQACRPVELLAICRDLLLQARSLFDSRCLDVEALILPSPLIFAPVQRQIPWNFELAWKYCPKRDASKGQQSQREQKGN